MPYEQITHEVSNQVATVTLNRPDKLNAWTQKMEQEVTEAIRVASSDDQVRVIILTGAGKGFCSGADSRYFPRSRRSPRRALNFYST